MLLIRHCSADARGPDEIFSGGFKAWGDNMNLAEHVSGDSQDSGYVATSKYQQSAQDCARQDCASENGLDYVYKLRGSGIDVNRALGLSPDSPFYAEHEVAIPHQVTPNAIEGVWGPGGWMDNPAINP